MIVLNFFFILFLSCQCHWNVSPDPIFSPFCRHRLYFAFQADTRYCMCNGCCVRFFLFVYSMAKYTFFFVPITHWHCVFRIALQWEKKSIINLSTHILIHRLFDTEKLFVVIVGSFSHSASPNVAFHFLSQAPTTHPIRIRIFEFRWHRALFFSHFDVSISNYFIFPKLPIYDISTCWIKKQTKIICKLFFDAFFMFKSFNLFRKLHYSNFWKNKIIEGTFKWLTLEIIKYQHRNDTKQKWTPKKLRNRWRNNKKKKSKEKLVNWNEWNKKETNIIACLYF